MPSSTPGSRLKSARNTLGLTQQGVAKQISVTVDAYKSWEQDRARPRTYSMIESLCQVLHITIGHYISGCANFILPPDETLLLEKYRQLSPEMQAALCTIIDENLKEKS